MRIYGARSTLLTCHEPSATTRMGSSPFVALRRSSTTAGWPRTMIWSSMCTRNGDAGQRSAGPGQRGAGRGPQWFWGFWGFFRGKNGQEVSIKMRSGAAWPGGGHPPSGDCAASPCVFSACSAVWFLSGRCAHDQFFSARRVGVGDSQREPVFPT